jgi:hypothetical protein
MNEYIIIILVLITIGVSIITTILFNKTSAQQKQLSQLSDDESSLAQTVKGLTIAQVTNFAGVPVSPLLLTQYATNTDFQAQFRTSKTDGNTDIQKLVQYYYTSSTSSNGNASASLIGPGLIVANNKTSTNGAFEIVMYVLPGDSVNDYVYILESGSVTSAVTPPNKNIVAPVWYTSPQTIAQYLGLSS